MSFLCRSHIEPLIFSIRAFSHHFLVRNLHITDIFQKKYDNLIFSDKKTLSIIDTRYNM